jgi:hypothetical protein
MKVEIDADELCELRKRAEQKESTFYYVSDHAAPAIQKMAADLRRLDKENEKLKAEAKWRDLSDYDDLMEERDWWRHQALSLAHNVDRDILRAGRALGFGDQERTWHKIVLKVAARHGYEVPQ